jgi:hypothetical protein
MFAISPIEKHDRTKKSIPINQSVETAPVIKSSFNVRPQIWQKFNKLPNITPEIPSHKTSLSESNVKLDEESERGDFSGRGDISGRGTSKTGGYIRTVLSCFSIGDIANMSELSKFLYFLKFVVGANFLSSAIIFFPDK